ncbi:MAG: tRNA dimethylallyltransferase [uncultured Thermomicrobiales bacterium]|uniref:tRNA dimethylallyltransferase n=1 Tax=uncultured Thermomicrobiales bacterium TaxID=1645740 RepID=A0A6J4VJZ0_9BACT|nr:MAG: tRNA dimethylallyltransferase [uncultured Thermomicrobiales bacterium]
MPDGRRKLVVVAGPTAVGKTAAGIALAERFGGEIVNADSRYLYRGFDIGVAKPSLAERRGVPHHLIDVLPPDGDMSLARYQDLAMDAIAGIHARGRLPLLVGGTPLYVNAVVEGWRVPRVPPDPALRAALEAEAGCDGLPALAARLAAVDPIAAARSGQNLRRVVRALEVYEKTGTPMSAQEGKGPPPFDALELGLTMPRDRLRAAVEDRVAAQLAAGLVDEVRGLLALGVPPDTPAMGSLGYRQLLPHLRGEADLAGATARIVADTHRYVRHQETWLRRNPRLVPVDVTRPDWLARAADLVASFLVRPEPGPPAGSGAPAAVATDSR